MRRVLAASALNQITSTNVGQLMTGPDLLMTPSTCAPGGRFSILRDAEVWWSRGGSNP
jgi:hypothetical protein